MKWLKLLTKLCELSLHESTICSAFLPLVLQLFNLKKIIPSLLTHLMASFDTITIHGSSYSSAIISTLIFSPITTYLILSVPILLSIHHSFLISASYKMAMLFLMTNYISISLNTTHLLAIRSNYPFHFISI